MIASIQPSIRLRLNTKLFDSSASEPAQVLIRLIQGEIVSKITTTTSMGRSSVTMVTSTSSIACESIQEHTPTSSVTMGSTIRSVTFTGSRIYRDMSGTKPDITRSFAQSFSIVR